MNVLCLFQKFDPDSSTIYLDLVLALKDRGHRVMIAACSSKEKSLRLENREGLECTYVPVPDQFNAGAVKKGLIQLTLGQKLIKCVKRYFWREKVDIIVYPTPPVTLSGILKPLKEHYGAVTYLMLKDIFPRNASDLKMMKENGLLFRYFRCRERELYRGSDVIGCMSPANIEYIRHHEGETVSAKTELFPNTVRIVPDNTEDSSRYEKNGEPDSGEKSYVNFFFGGNLGKPQAVDFLLKGIGRLSSDETVRFTFIGSGTEEGRIRDYIDRHAFKNLRLLHELPRREYEKLLNEADIGIVSLSPLFTIPNFPSRILSYMQMAKPVFAVTDRTTDIGTLVTRDARCGFWCPSDDIDAFTETVKRIVSEKELLPEYGRRGREYLIKNFNVESSVDILERAFREKGRDKIRHE